MGQVMLSCRSCSRIKIFRGKDVKEVIRKIDESGWIDRPQEQGNSCPDCAKEEA